MSLDALFMRGLIWASERDMIRLMALWPKSGVMFLLFWISTLTLSPSKLYFSYDSADKVSLTKFLELFTSLKTSGDIIYFDLFGSFSSYVDRIPVWFD